MVVKFCELIMSTENGVLSLYGKKETDKGKKMESC